jgi:hypothetical protein
MRPEVFDEVDAVFRGGNLAHRARTLEYLLSRTETPSSSLLQLDPVDLARLSDEETEPPGYYTLSVKYPDGEVMTESYYSEDGERAPEIVLTVAEAKEMLRACLTEIVVEIDKLRADSHHQ